MKKNVIRALVLCVLAFPALSRSASAQTLYGATPGATSQLYEINPTTGAFTPIGDIGFGITALAFHPLTGELFGTQAGVPGGGPGAFDRNLIRINPTTGAGTIVGPIGLGLGGIADIAFRSDGTLFGWSETTDALITINLTTGAGTLIGSDPGISTRGSGLAFNQAGTLFLAGNNGNGPLRTVNTTTGLTTVGPTLSGAPHPTQPVPAMKFHPVTDVLYAVNRQVAGTGTTFLITIDTTTGAITTIGPTLPRTDALAWSSIPRRLHPLYTGTGTGSAATVRAFNIASAIVQGQVMPYGGFTGGVTVAQGDTNSDGMQDLITGAGPGGSPHVQVIDGRSGQTRLSFFAFDAFTGGGVEVAAGDINGDGFSDVIAVTGCAPTVQVRAFHGLTGALLRTYQYTPSVGGCGQHIAAGDVNGDGATDIIVGAGSGGSVGVINGSSGAIMREFLPYSGATPGVYVAAGDVTGDGFADIVTGAGAGGGPHVRVFDGTTGTQIVNPVGSFMAYPVDFSGGVRVAAGDLTGDGRAEVITGAGSGGGPHLRVWDGATSTEIYGLFAFDPAFAGGIFVAGPTPIGRMNVDLPAVRIAGTDVRVAGWALREFAANSVGTDAIHAWAYPVGGAAPIFVGAAPFRVPRPDVSAAFGGEFLMSGFDFVGTLAAGTYDLVVYARNSRSFQFDQARVMRITVP